jgi:cob(I)alamin adenosyltransferase
VVYLSRIYTKSGDQGETGLGDGQRVRKDHPRVVACGEVDELNAVIGLALLVPELPEAGLLRAIQNDLFDVGGDLCVPLAGDEETGKRLRITSQHVAKLEAAIDRLNEKLQPLRSFVLPGGSAAAAHLHVARTVCRRAERAVVTLMAAEPINTQGTLRPRAGR